MREVCHPSARATFSYLLFLVIFVSRGRVKFVNDDDHDSDNNNHILNDNGTDFNSTNSQV